MKEPSHHLRKAIITALTGQVLVDAVALSIYNQVPANATYPYIRINTIDNTDESAKDSFISDIAIRIEVVTRYSADDGGELDCNLAIDKILTLLIRTELDLSASGFKVVTAKKDRVFYFQDITDKFNYYRGILDIDYKIEQL